MSKTKANNEDVAISVDLKTLDNVLSLVDPEKHVSLQMSSTNLIIEYHNAETRCDHIIKLKGNAVKV